MDLFLNKDFWIGLLGAIIALDTVLGYIPAIKSNSTFQLIDNTLRKILSFIVGK